MKFEKKISPELRNILKSCTTVAQRQEIANDHLMSLHTLNAVINGQRSITNSTKKAVIDLVIKAIENAKEFNQSLINYYTNLNK